MKARTLRLALAAAAFAVLAVVFSWREVPARQERALARYPPDCRGAPDVRVKLLSRAEGVWVSVTGRFDLIGESGRSIGHLNTSLPRVRVRRSGGGLAVGDRRLKHARLEFRPISTEWATSEACVDGVPVPGSVIVTNAMSTSRPGRAAGGHGAAAVARMDVESYLCVALASRPGWRRSPDGALAAEAVCLRTLALYRRALARAGGRDPPRGGDRQGEGDPRRRPAWDIGDERGDRPLPPGRGVIPLLETLRSGAHRSARVALAVNGTRGLALTWDGRLFPARMTASCGGRTEDTANVFTASSITPLSGVECDHCAGLPAEEVEWRVRLPTSRLTEKLRPRVERLARMGAVKRIEAAPAAPGGTSVRPGGRIHTLRIETTFGPFDMSVADFRAACGEDVIPAAPTKIRDVGPKTVELSGRGRGPGVGLCRLGAERMARDGAPFEEILTRYFPGARLARLPYRGREE